MGYFAMLYTDDNGGSLLPARLMASDMDLYWPGLMRSYSYQYFMTRRYSGDRGSPPLCPSALSEENRVLTGSGLFVPSTRPYDRGASYVSHSRNGYLNYQPGATIDSRYAYKKIQQVKGPSHKNLIADGYHVCVQIPNASRVVALPSPDTEAYYAWGRHRKNAVNSLFVDGHVMDLSLQNPDQEIGDVPWFNYYFSPT